MAAKYKIEIVKFSAKKFKAVCKNDIMRTSRMTFKTDAEAREWVVEVNGLSAKDEQMIIIN